MMWYDVLGLVFFREVLCFEEDGFGYGLYQKIVKRLLSRNDEEGCHC